MRMKNISDSEFEVMKVVWSEEPVETKRIVEILKDKTNWTSRTIRTLIDRLREKGALHYRKEGKSYLYQSALPKKECLKRETDSFLNKLFDGAMTPMLAHFAKYYDLDEKDIEEMRKIISKKGE